MAEANPASNADLVHEWRHAAELAFGAELDLLRRDREFSRGEGTAVTGEDRLRVVALRARESALFGEYVGRWPRSGKH